MTATRRQYTPDTFPWDKLLFHKSLASVPAHLSHRKAETRRRTAELVLAVPGLLEFMLELEDRAPVPSHIRYFMLVKTTKQDGRDSLGLHWEGFDTDEFMRIAELEAAWGEQEETAATQAVQEVVYTSLATVRSWRHTLRIVGNKPDESLRLRLACSLTGETVLLEAAKMLQPDEADVFLLGYKVQWPKVSRSYSTGTKLPWSVRLCTFRWATNDEEFSGTRSEFDHQLDSFYGRLHQDDVLKERFGRLTRVQAHLPSNTTPYSHRYQTISSAPVAWWDKIRHPWYRVDGSFDKEYADAHPNYFATHPATIPVVGTDHLRLDMKKGEHGSVRVRAFLDWCEENGLQVKWTRPHGPRNYTLWRGPRVGERAVDVTGVEPGWLTVTPATR